MLQPFCSSNSFKTMNLIPCTVGEARCAVLTQTSHLRWNSAVWEGSYFLGFFLTLTTLTNAPGGGADTHNNVDHNIFQQMWHRSCSLSLSIDFEIQNFNEKISKYRECTLSFKAPIWECAKDRKGKFDPTLSQRWPGGKAWEKHTAFQISIIWKCHSFIACYALLYIPAFLSVCLRHHFLAKHGSLTSSF